MEERKKRLYKVDTKHIMNNTVKAVKSRVSCWTEKETKPTEKSTFKKFQSMSRFKRNDNLTVKLLRDGYNQIEKESEPLRLPKETDGRNVPRLKEISFYVKSYKNDIYPELKAHLDKQYQELKN